MDQRLKGQEVEIRYVRDGNIDDAFKAIASFDDALKFDLKVQGYLGETTERHDEVYNGVSGSCKMHVQSKLWMTFQQAIKDRARRVTPGTVINIVRTDFYPNGESATRIYPDVHFGEMPSSVPSRQEYVEVSFTFGCDDNTDDLGNIL